MKKEIVLIVLFNVCAIIPTFAQKENEKVISENSHKEIEGNSEKEIENKNVESEIDTSIQNSINELKKKLDAMTNRSIQFGMSVGYRYMYKNAWDYQSASISPLDSTLQLQRLDQDAILISTALIVSPFENNKFIRDVIENAKYDKSKNREKFGANSRLVLGGMAKNLTFIATLNIIEFNGFQKDFGFNKSIEGGLGLGLNILDDAVWIGITYEKVNSRQLRSFAKEQAGKKLRIDGKTVTELDENNENLFYTQKFSTVSFKIIFRIK